MWSPFVFENRNYLIKITKDSSVSIVLTDLQLVWKSQVSGDKLFNNFKQYNPLCDFASLTVDDVVDHVLSLVDSICTKSAVVTRIKSLEDNGDELELEMKLNDAEFSTRFVFNLSKAGSDVFFKELTLPLVQTVQYLETQRAALCDLLEKKDSEIEEHRLEGGEITTRTNLVTEKFDKTSFVTTRPGQDLFLDVWGRSKEFCDNLVATHGADRKLFKQKKEKAPILPKKKPKLSHNYDISSTGIPYNNV